MICNMLYIFHSNNVSPFPIHSAAGFVVFCLKYELAMGGRQHLHLFKLLK